MQGTVMRGIAAVLATALFAVAALAQTTDSAKPPAKKTAKAKKAPDRAAGEQQYRQARALEAKGDEKGALLAYQAAGNNGHGLAQKRLGEIYEKGNSATRRDYDTALRWYEQARAQGIEIPKPIPYQKR
jgi:TPR repeat protein